MNYLSNTWYVAAWGDDIQDGLLHRKILNKPVLLFRTENGAIAAIGGRCPHRFAPLHMGKKIGDAVECLYHGLRFDAKGACVHNPHGDGKIPAAATVQSYLAVERHGLVWIWMGEKAAADPDTIPDYGFLIDPGWVTVKGTICGAGHYELYTDNILDLGHAAFLHTGLSAPAFTIGERRIYEEAGGVWSNISLMNDFASDVVSFILDEVGQRVDSWIDTRWDAPASMVLTQYVSKPGAGKDNAKILPTLHIFTPETETTTYYFWAVTRNIDMSDERSAVIRQAFDHVFETEDKPMIAAQQEMMETTDLFALNPVLLPGDAGGVRARRVLARLISNEQSATRKAG